MPYAQAHLHEPQVFRSVPFVELRQSLPSRVSIVRPFIDQLMRFIARFRNADGSELEIETAVRKALANAIIHGNHEDARKLVCVTCRCTIDGEVSISVEDEGRGFDTEGVKDPVTAGNQLLAQRRAIYRMRTLLDEIHFEQGGAVVFMRKASNSRPKLNSKAA